MLSAGVRTLRPVSDEEHGKDPQERSKLLKRSDQTNVRLRIGKSGF
jgi:hypothetical protein